MQAYLARVWNPESRNCYTTDTYNYSVLIREVLKDNCVADNNTGQ